MSIWISLFGAPRQSASTLAEVRGPPSTFWKVVRFRLKKSAEDGARRRVEFGVVSTAITRQASPRDAPPLCAHSRRVGWAKYPSRLFHHEQDHRKRWAGQNMARQDCGRDVSIHLLGRMPQISRAAYSQRRRGTDAEGVVMKATKERYRRQEELTQPAADTRKDDLHGSPRGIYSGCIVRSICAIRRS